MRDMGHFNTKTKSLKQKPSLELWHMIGQKQTYKISSPFLLMSIS